MKLAMFSLKKWGQKRKAKQSNREQKDESSAVNLAFEPDINSSPATASSKTDVQLVSSLTDIQIISKEMTVKAEKSGKCPANCVCWNCRMLEELTECGVCFETLQSIEIKSCPVCANVFCPKCADRISSCAFCASVKPLERNRALERLIDALLLPCNNYNSGCGVKLDGESRLFHQSMCSFSTVGCPVGRGVCRWAGTIATIRSHLFNEHNLKPLQDYGISVEVDRFRSKARAPHGHVYTVCLSCFGQLFVMKLSTYGGFLRILLVRLGPEDADTPSMSTAKYGVSVLIEARGGKRRQGLVPFGLDREGRQLNITCDSLYPASKAGLYTADADSVKVNLCIKQIDGF